MGTTLVPEHQLSVISVRTVGLTDKPAVGIPGFLCFQIESAHSGMPGSAGQLGERFSVQVQAHIIFFFEAYISALASAHLSFLVPKDNL